MMLFAPDFPGGVRVPGLSTASAPAAPSSAPPAADPAFGQPFSELPREAQQAVLAEIEPLRAG